MTIISLSISWQIIFLLAIVLSALLWFTYSDYPFCILKPFLYPSNHLFIYLAIYMSIYIYSFDSEHLHYFPLRNMQYVSSYFEVTIYTQFLFHFNTTNKFISPLTLNSQSNKYVYLMSFCPFSFSHCVVWPSLIYVFWLPLLYPQTLLVSI
jgi:hypothetical protein